MCIDHDDPMHLVQELFALLTTLSEDASHFALDGQGCDDLELIEQLAERSRQAGQQIMVIASAIMVIAAGPLMLECLAR